MKYEIIWQPRAEDELTRLWLDSPQRETVRLAADEIDMLLKMNPLDAGESRSDNRRILFVAPLGVVYRVFEVDRRVKVLRVWRYTTGSD